MSSPDHNYFLLFAMKYLVQEHWDWSIGGGGLPNSSILTCRAALISMMPVFLMNSGRSKGGFSIPRLPCKYFRLKHQCLGTGTVFLMDLRCTNNPGSLAVTSCISTTSGLVTSCFNSATDNRLSFFNFRLLNFLSPSSPKIKIRKVQFIPTYLLSIFYG